MKVAIIIVLYKTPRSEIERIKIEIKEMGFADYKLYFIDNTKENRGYAAGLNVGIKKGLRDGGDIFITANPDLSFAGMKAEKILEGLSLFDLLGYTMKQDGKTYYGGVIDKWRMSGGLSEVKPKKRFVEVDFVSGSLMAVKKSAIESIGLRDEGYFVYYEDVEYCYRAKRAGLRVGIDSEVTYTHFESSKTNVGKSLELSQMRRKFLGQYGSLEQKVYELLRWPKTFLEDKGILDQSGTRRYLVNFFSLNISSFIGKILNFILFIFLIRFLPPSEYGIYTLVWAQASLFAPIVDLGTTSYGIVHLQSKKKNEFVSLFNLRLLVAVIVFFATILVSYEMFLHNQRIVHYTTLVSFVIFSNMFSGTYLIKNAIEGKLFNSSFVGAGFNLILVLSLITSSVFFRSLSVLFLVIFIFYNLYSLINYVLIKRDIKEFSFSLDLEIWKIIVKKSYHFILISFFAGLYFKIDVFLLQRIKGEQAVGVYSAGFKFLEALLFIASSYNISRTPIFSALYKKGIGYLVKIVKKDVVYLSLLGLLIAAFTFFASPLVLPLFMKGSYQQSIAVVRIVMFALPLILISSVLLNALYVLNRAAIVVKVFLFQVLLNFALNYIFIPKYSYIASSYITLISEIANVVILVITFRFILNKHYENIN